MKQEPNVAPPRTAVKQLRSAANRPRKLLARPASIKPPAWPIAIKLCALLKAAIVLHGYPKGGRRPGSIRAGLSRQTARLRFTV